MTSPTPGLIVRSRSARRDEGYVRPIAGALNLGADHVDAINRSHDRCAALGLSRIEAPDLGLLGRADLEIARVAQPAAAPACRAGDGAAARPDRQHPQHGGADRRHRHHRARRWATTTFSARATKVALSRAPCGRRPARAPTRWAPRWSPRCPRSCTPTSTTSTPTTFSPARRRRSSTRAATSSACSTSRATIAATTSTRWRWSRCRRA